jgi:hypothetical protein
MAQATEDAPPPETEAATVERSPALGSEYRAPFGLEPSQLEDLPEQEQGWLKATASNIPALAETAENAVREARERLEEDGRLTEEGVDEKMSEVREELAEVFLGETPDADLPGSGLAHQRYVVERVKRSAHQMRQAMPLYPEPDDADARSAVREQELRRKIEATDDPQERTELARRLVDSGQPEALRAVFDAPGGVTPFAPERLDLLRRRALQKQYGEDAFTPERMLEAAERAETALDRLEAHLRDVLGHG